MPRGWCTVTVEVALGKVFFLLGSKDSLSPVISQERGLGRGNAGAQLMAQALGTDAVENDVISDSKIVKL